jgi:hypothetical protein
VFGWAVAFAKAVVGCDFEKGSCEKHAVGKAEDRLVQQLWLLKQMLNGPHMSSIAQISHCFPLSLTCGPSLSASSSSCSRCVHRDRKRQPVGAVKADRAAHCGRLCCPVGEAAPPVEAGCTACDRQRGR